MKHTLDKHIEVSKGELASPGIPSSENNLNKEHNLEQKS